MPDPSISAPEQEYAQDKKTPLAKKPKPVKRKKKARLMGKY